MDNTPIWVWIAFNVFILAMLAIDLGVFNRKEHVISIKESLTWTGVWIGCALIFAGVIWFWRPEDTLEYLTGYLIEKSLSMDNIFVFLLIFRYFGVQAKHQHKVLFWGILGALVFRAIFIFAGAALLDRFHWMVYILGAFLIYTGARSAWETEKEVHPEKNPVLRFARKHLPMTTYEKGNGHFFIKENGKRLATPLFLVLLVIETTDIIFALDSIPAILAITRQEFIVYSAMAFAVLGLRALYFALAGLMEKLRYLHYGISAVLVFVGIKLILDGAGLHIPIWASLTAVVVLLGVSVIYSLWGPRTARGKQEEREDWDREDKQQTREEMEAEQPVGTEEPAERADPPPTTERDRTE